MIRRDPAMVRLPGFGGKGVEMVFGRSGGGGMEIERGLRVGILSAPGLVSAAIENTVKARGFAHCFLSPTAETDQTHFEQ